MRHPPFWSLAHLDIWHRTRSNPYFPYWNDVSFCRDTVELEHGWQQLELLLLILKLVSLCWFHPLLHFTILSQCIGRRPEGFEPSSRLLIECRRLSDPRYPRKLILLVFIARLFPGLFLRSLNPARITHVGYRTCIKDNRKIVQWELLLGETFLNLRLCVQGCPRDRCWA